MASEHSRREECAENFNRVFDKVDTLFKLSAEHTQADNNAGLKLGELEIRQRLSEEQLAVNSQQSNTTVAKLTELALAMSAMRDAGGRKATFWNAIVNNVASAVITVVVLAILAIVLNHFGMVALVKSPDSLPDKTQGQTDAK